MLSKRLTWRSRSAETVQQVVGFFDRDGDGQLDLAGLPTSCELKIRMACSRTW